MIMRNLDTASAQVFDIIIIGGGILGACHALESVRRGFSVLLLERDDFGGATSWSSHRIVHGGLRYVQSLDFSRHRESIRERQWFLRCFPEQVRPLPCLMPLYDRGLKRRSTFRAAFLIDDMLSRKRNIGLDPAHHLPPGRLLSVQETRRRFPAVESTALRGGALWHDGFMLCPQRILMEILRWAASAGARALNYVGVEKVRPDGASGFAVQAADRVDGGAWIFRARHIINCAGPWAGGLHDEEGPAMSAAFSLVLNRPPISDCAVAVSPHQKGDPMYFIVPLREKLLAGTVHLPTDGGRGCTGPTEADIAEFLRHLNAAVPDLAVTPSDILRVFSGRLPAVADHSARTLGHPVRRFHVLSTQDHRFVTVWGVKYTTARSAAEGTLRLLFPQRAPADLPRPEAVGGVNLAAWETPTEENRATYESVVHRIQREESVVHVDDLLLRRTDWGTLPPSAEAARAVIAPWLELPAGGTDGGALSISAACSQGIQGPAEVKKC